MNQPKVALLFDENISYRVVKRISHLFPGSQSVNQLDLVSKKDGLIWETAKRLGLAIITYDEDYHALSQLRGWPPKVILLKTGNMTNAQLAALLEINFTAIESFLLDQEKEYWGVLELYHLNLN